MIPAELIAELAKSAKLAPLTPFRDAAPEQGYTPWPRSPILCGAGITCRAPGCDRPATRCDPDHTGPYATGGATHALNIKCLSVFTICSKRFGAGTTSSCQTGR